MDVRVSGGVASTEKMDQLLSVDFQRPFLLQPKEGYVFVEVCLCVCVCPSVFTKYLKKLWTAFDEILWRGGAWNKKKQEAQLLLRDRETFMSL